MRLRPLALLPLALAALLPSAAPAHADGKLPGEAAELTPEVRATAQKHLDVITGLKPDADKAQRALLLLGPVVWPVVENACRLTPPEEAKPRLNFLKAMLAKKAEPDFEWLRDRLRRKLLGGNLADLVSELTAFRLGHPDPDHPGRKIPPTVTPTVTGTVSVYRSGDGTIVVGYGGDGTAAKPDAGNVQLNEPTAGFVAAVAGRAAAKAAQSGNGGEAVAVAPKGYAYAWASDGAAGVKPGGAGGSGGSADARGGAGQWSRAGNGGAAAGS